MIANVMNMCKNRKCLWLWCCVVRSHSLEQTLLVSAIPSTAEAARELSGLARSHILLGKSSSGERAHSTESPRPRVSWRSDLPKLFWRDDLCCLERGIYDGIPNVRGNQKSKNATLRLESRHGSQQQPVVDLPQKTETRL